MSKYVIKEITNVKMIIPKMELVKKNKPVPKLVTKEEYYEFLKASREHICISYNIGPADTYVTKDKYGNVIASVYYYVEESYHINPELMQLGIELERYIEDEFKKVGEETIDLGDCKSCNMDS